MKTIVSADIHLHNSDSYGTYNRKGENSLLLSKVRAVDEIIDATADCNGHLAIAGDIINDRMVDSATLFYLTKLVNKMKKLKLTILLEGNHGYDAKNNIHSSISFLKHTVPQNIKIVTSPEVIHADGISYYCLPAISNLEEKFVSIAHELLKDIKKGNRRILVGHVGVVGAKFDSGIISKAGLDDDSLDSLSAYFDAVVLGDYHRPQTLGEGVWYTGSPVPWSMRDKGQDKSYQIIDWDKNSVEVAKINRGKFLSINWDLSQDAPLPIKEPVGFKDSLKEATISIKLSGYSHEFADINIDSMRKQFLECGASRVLIDKKTHSQHKMGKAMSVTSDIKSVVHEYCSVNNEKLPAKINRVLKRGLLYLGKED